MRYLDPTGHYKDSDNDELRGLISPYTQQWNDAQDTINGLDSSSPDYGDQLGRLQKIQLSAETAADSAREVYYYQKNRGLPSDIRFAGSSGSCADCASDSWKYMDNPAFKFAASITPIGRGPQVVRLGEEGIAYATSNASRMQHAFKHAQDLGFGNWSKQTASEWNNYVSNVLRTADKSFDNVLGGEVVKGFYKEVNGQAVGVYVYAEGKFQGFVATVVRLSDQQMAKFGLK
ncbi:MULTISPECIES: hypothetical protein [unclassified Paenibacillus]|uniref:hypothetical protein n=1 Tax=unclassified Paenibacillus TaxID=185978 RepID=UPI00363B3A24